MLDKVLKYKTHLLVAILVVIIVVVFVFWWKRKDETTIKIVDDSGHQVSFTNEQTAQAKAISERIHADLNSGWFFGSNIIGSVGRDDEAYNTLAAMNDSLFALTCQTYKNDFKSSLITDLRNESSLDGRDYYTAILAKATRLNIA